MQKNEWTKKKSDAKKSKKTKKKISKKKFILIGSLTVFFIHRNFFSFHFIHLLYILSLFAVWWWWCFVNWNEKEGCIAGKKKTGSEERKLEYWKLKTEYISILKKMNNEILCHWCWWWWTSCLFVWFSYIPKILERREGEKKQILRVFQCLDFWFWCQLS